MKDSYVQNGN